MTTSTTTAFAMPSLGADMDEGRIVEWLVTPGDHVDRGQIVVIVQTEKSDIEVEVFEAATVAELLVAEGEQVAVGTPIALMEPDRPGHGTTAPAPPPAPAEAVTTSLPTDAADASDTARPAPRPGSVEGGVTSPVLRHLAEELHVDPTRVRGTGPGGRIHRDDIRHAAARRAGTRFTPRARRLLRERGIGPTRFEGQALVTGDDVLALPQARSAADRAAERQASMRRHIADLMKRSWHEIPHFHVAKRLDLSAAEERLTRVNEHRSPSERLVPGALLLCAAARAAVKAPECNGWWHHGRFEPADRVDLGVVLSLRTGGIIVPTIASADRLSPDEMMVRLSELVQQARQGRLRSSHLGEATITVTSLGDRGADAVYGVIHPPQVGLVGFGAVHDAVWPDTTGATVRPTVEATFTGDHRAIDGLAGSRFLAHVQSLLGRTLLDELEDT
jgi:pyruvate dehydrogenase E2 component (dihydrolipoamide acetyltransferase)